MIYLKCDVGQLPIVFEEALYVMVANPIRQVADKDRV